MPEGLWPFVSLGDYQLPRLPVRGAVQKNWAALKRLFRRRTDPSSPFKPDAELRALDENRLARLLATPDWGMAAAALDAVLRDRLDRQAGEAGVRFIVGQPHSGLDEIVRFWAAGRAAVVMPPPDDEQLLGVDAGWLERFSDEMSGPTLPSERDDGPVLVLHALLIHGGLPEALLPELLPLPRARCMSLLLALRDAGAVRRVEGRWRIRALAYAAVREVLRGRDYLVDHF